MAQIIKRHYTKSDCTMIEKVIYVPDWNVVKFPNGRVVIYLTTQKALNGRILARAWFNFYEQHKELGFKKKGWSDIARYLGVEKKPPYRTNGIDYAGTGFYRLVCNGALPKDEKAKQKLFDLAGYPWK